MFRLSGSAGLIVDILSSEFPLSVKEIHAKLKRSHASDVTYQAVHKKIAELLSEGILEKEEKKFRLSKNWITEGKDFFNRIEAFYDGKILSSFIPQDRETFAHTFNKPIDFARFLITFALEFPNPENKSTIFSMWCYYPTFRVLSERTLTAL